MKNSLATLTLIADTLYDPEIYFQSLYEACQNYKSLLLEITEISLEDSQHNNDIFTDSGRAIGTEWAIRCVEDITRTKTYCKGLYDAVLEMDRQQDRPVRVIYAGTGPFATLALPLITRFTPDQLQFDLLEINQASAGFLKKVINFFEMEDYVNLFEVTDATTYQIPNPETVNIVLSETMQAALASEPQVALSYNLMSQLPEKAVLIPEEISLHLYAINDDKRQHYKLSMEEVDQTSYYSDLGLLYKINKEEIGQYAQQIKAMGSEAAFDPVIISVPSDTHRKFHNLMIATKIKVYKENEIQLESSGLTALRQFESLNPMMQTVKSLKATYFSGEYPGLNFELNP